LHCVDGTTDRELISMRHIWRLQNGLAHSDNTFLERWLLILSTYALPIFLALSSIGATIAFDPSYALAPGEKLAFRAFTEETTALTPTQARSRLQLLSQTEQYNTRLVERPVWFSVVAKPATNARLDALEFPSRHATAIMCWDLATLKPLGQSDRTESAGAMRVIKAGFALTLAPDQSDRQVLCRGSFRGPARITVLQWQESELGMAALEFHRNSGLLDGGLLVLATFVLIAALINRNGTYILFACWLIVNLRMGALAAGWDTQWLGHSLPTEWMTQIRALTLVVFYILTLMLFSSLFREDLLKLKSTRLLRLCRLSCAPLLILSIVLPYKFLLPVIWIASGFCCVTVVYYLASIVKLTRSPVALWYAASIFTTVSASLYEIICAALGYTGLISAVNYVTAGLLASILAALALAHQMRIHHRQRLDAQAELQHTFQAMPIGLFTLDLRGRFLSANPALHTALGVDDVMLPGNNSWAQYFNIGSWEQLHDIVHVDGDSELQLQRNRAPDSTDEIQHFMVKATLARGKIEGSLQDVTQQLKATEDLRFMANNDPLTKVYNRRGIEHALADAVAELAEGKPLALAYLDLDRFKLINDLYGHGVGDEVLKLVCKRVSGMLSGGQHMGRVGGDEFVIVLPDTSIVLASWICRGIVNSISNAAFCIGDKAFQVRGSIGLIEVSQGTQIRDAVATADRACRAAKKVNHGSLVVYEKNAPAVRELEAELDLVERLSSGVVPEGLFVEMQPIMSLKKPFESLNFEVLLRMRDYDGSLIPTWRVITAAENSGQISVIDRWVLSTTLAWLDTNQAVLVRTQFVCMNLSGASLNDERFIQDAFVMLSENLHVANRLCIEITESVALHDLENTRRFIDKVRGYGVKVGLDDFGAGYTSFSYLRELPADILKIDGNFIVDMNAHPANIAIVEAIVSLAMNLGMKTIAEWAEDASTVQTLAEIGVDYVQGFVVARPQAPELILAAQSSASFITDETLMEFVESLGTTRILPQDRRKPTRSEDLH